MKSIIARAVLFIKENPRIIFSLVLVVLIPAAFFINTYMINSRYEAAIDKIIQKKTVLAENIINNLVETKITDKDLLQSSLEKITAENSEIVSLLILQPLEGESGSFQIIAANDKQLIGQIQSDSLQNVIAWTKPEGVAFLDRGDNGRFWNVTKSLSDEAGNKVGLIAMAFSLQESDQLINKTINNSYWVLIVTVLIVVLLVSNQARLFGYALTLSKLKEIDRMKDMFISMASHELRAPLTAIKGYVEFLQDTKELNTDKDSKHYIENISLSVDRLQNLVNDILEVSRLEGNSLPIEITTFDPLPIVSQSIEELRSQAMQKGLAVKTNFSDAPALIKADINRLKQVVVNLISNAIKYTPQGSVEIKTEIKNNDWLITVADTGIGISSEDQANLFQKFYRIKNEKTQNIIGTGLGLWITLEIARRMNGKITVESIEGVGSHFTLHLPLAKN